MHHALRGRQIDQMASIFAGANRVFTLDRELMATPIPSHYSETLYSIASSVWMSRMWTLQGSILPKCCLFPFADAIFHPSKPSSKVTELETLITIWSALASRSSLMPGDEWMVLANCLRFDLRQLLVFPIQERI